MKRVLIIAYFFPRQPTMGSHRALAIRAYRREHGWTGLLTGPLEGWPQTDAHLLERRAADITVIVWRDGSDCVAPQTARRSCRRRRVEGERVTRF